MKRFLAKIGRFFWSRGFLKFVLWTITLIALFYIEEDWRGAHMWAQTKAKWEAKGESFDFTRLIPPPIPDSENLGAIPLFKLDPDPQTSGQLEPLVLRKALHQDIPDFGISIKGGWYKEGSPNLRKIDSAVAAAYMALFHTTPPTNDPLAQLEAVYSFIAELNADSATRPYCRFAMDDTSPPPYERLFAPIVLQLSVAKILAFHAYLALAAHRSDLALTDIETVLKLASGVRDEPFLFCGLVAIAETAVIEGPIENGLALHFWTDAQLAQIESDLGRFDFLYTFQLDIRGELTGFLIPTLDDQSRSRDTIKLLTESSKPTAMKRSFTVANVIFDLFPSGWLEQNKCSSANLLLTSANSVDPALHRAFPEHSEDVVRRVRKLENSWPWNIFVSLSGGPVTAATIHFARAQVWLDQMRIACALERYRLAHGAYPATLDELAPAYIAEVPHDIINGEPYRYRLRPDGTFLLYSVGWNEKDEGGLIVTTAPNPNDPDDSKDKHGDWVWPTLR